jgi:uncharacterized membrane protein YheB (UPF0754 family)
MLREPTEKFLGENINAMLQKNSKQRVSQVIEIKTNDFLEKQICDLLYEHDEQIKQAIDIVESIYCKIVKGHFLRILGLIDISKIAREWIEMDVNETENPIFRVINKKIKYIVWLGVLLGMIIGCINIIVILLI